ncbi:MAG: hypothetical protein PHX86_07800, partial [Caldisericia bacterium]|nr:hypothetical protein [Caldisericia bacterium]
MKFTFTKKILSLVLIFFIFNVSYFVSNSSTVKAEEVYSADKAIAYARDYHEKLNIDGADFREKGAGDCAHFVSLCIGNLSEAIDLGNITKKTAELYGGGISLRINKGGKGQKDKYLGTPIFTHINGLDYYGGIPVAGMYYNGDEGAKRSGYKQGDTDCNQNLGPWLCQNDKAEPKDSVKELLPGDVIIYGYHACWVREDFLNKEEGNIVEIQAGVYLRTEPSEKSTILGNTANKKQAKPYTGIVVKEAPDNERTKDTQGNIYQWCLISLDSMIRDDNKNHKGCLGGHAVLYLGDNKISDHHGLDPKVEGYWGKDYKHYIDYYNKDGEIDIPDTVSDEIKRKLEPVAYIHIKANKSSKDSDKPPKDPDIPTVTYKLQVLDDESGEPVVRAMVSVIDGDGGKPIQKYTDSSGRVDIIGKPSGMNWIIELSKEGYETKELCVWVDKDKSDDIRLSPLEKVSFTIYVLDTDGDPLHTAKVTTKDANQVTTEKYTDKDGKAVFVGTKSTISGTQWSIKIELNGFKSVEWEQYVRKDTEKKVTLYPDEKSGDGGGVDQKLTTAPSPKSPPCGSTVKPGEVKFEWSSVKHATKYEFELYNSYSQIAGKSTYTKTYCFWE